MIGNCTRVPEVRMERKAQILKTSAGMGWEEKLELEGFRFDDCKVEGEV